jgi:PAS domain S-box-containing protein
MSAGEQQAEGAGEGRFKALVEAMPQLVWVLRPDRGVDYASPQWEACTGAPEAALLGRGWLDAVHPDDRAAAEQACGAAAPGTPFEFEHRLRVRDGDSRWFLSRFAPVREESGAASGWIATSTEIEGLRAESARHDALTASELVVREADHRIRNSLQLVAALVAVQRARLGEAEAAAAAALDDAAGRLRAVAEAHRALERAADPRKFVFGALLRTLCALLAELHPGTEFECDAPDGIELEAARGVPTGLIVHELLAEAGRRAAGQVRLSAAAANGAIAVTVRDDGPADAAPAGTGVAITAALARTLDATLAPRSAHPDGGGVAAVTVPLGAAPLAQGTR